MLKSISIILCLAVFVLIWFIHGCEKEVLLNSQTEENNSDAINNNLEILIKLNFRDIDNHALNNCNVVVDNGTSCSSFFAESDTIDISLIQDGDFEVAVTKDGYLQHNFDISIKPTLNKGVLYYKRNIILAKRQSVVTIDKNGGIIKDHSGKFSLSVPKGALSKSENISATEIPTLLKAGILEPLAKRLPLKTFHFEPDGLVFSKEVQVEVDISDISKLFESDIYLGYYHEDVCEWELKKGTISPDGNSATFGIDHFSEWSIVYPYRISSSNTDTNCNLYTGSCCNALFVSGYSFDVVPPELQSVLIPCPSDTFYYSYYYGASHGFIRKLNICVTTNYYSVEKFNPTSNIYEPFSSFSTIEDVSIIPDSESCTCTHHRGGSGF